MPRGVGESLLNYALDLRRHVTGQFRSLVVKPWHPVVDLVQLDNDAWRTPLVAKAAFLGALGTELIDKKLAELVLRGVLVVAAGGQLRTRVGVHKPVRLCDVGQLLDPVAPVLTLAGIEPDQCAVDRLGRRSWSKAQT